MKLAFNATTLRNFHVIEAVRMVRAAGYDGVELSVNDTHLHPYRSTKEQILEVKKVCEDIGLAIACVAAGGPTVLGDPPYEPSFLSTDKKGRCARTEVAKRCIEMAQMLGCPTVNLNSGIQPESMTDPEASYFMLEGLNFLIPLLGNDTVLALEPEPGFYVGTTTIAIEMLNAINNPKVRLNLDIGHVFCSQYEEDCYAAVEAALPYTRHIHIEDIKGHVHFHEIPGDGDIDFKRIVGMINAANYAHYVSVELHNHDQQYQDALDRSRSYLLAL
ncbi:MAG: sugar phosphate isomerase/epimerase [Oscillospiraceae bacterium]|nr:sugar phosphate isomerase/epimerase [Oscillospiraceae bacterium]